MEEQITKIAESVIQAGGLGVFVVLVMKWFISKSFNDANKLEELKEKNMNSAINRIEGLFGEVKNEVVSLKDRIFHNEKVHLESVGKLNLHSDKLDGMMKAMEGFVETTNRRLERVESLENKRLSKANGLARSKSGVKQ